MGAMVIAIPMTFLYVVLVPARSTIQGFLAWWIWRNYYLVNLPTLQKRVRVLSDWALDIFFKRDVTMLKTLAEEKY